MHVGRQAFANQDGSRGVLYLVGSDNTDLDHTQLITIY